MLMTKMVTIWQLKTHFLFMTRLLDGDMQLTLISVVPCLLQIAIEKRPKLARMTCDGKMKELIILCLIVTLMVWSEAQDMVNFSPSHL